MEFKNARTNLSAASPEPDPCEQLGSLPQGMLSKLGALGSHKHGSLFYLIKFYHGNSNLEGNQSPVGEQKVQTRLDTPREGDAILSHGPTLWIIPPISTALTLENPFPSDSTRSGARDKHQQVLPRFGIFGLKQPEKKPHPLGNGTTIPNGDNREKLFDTRAEQREANPRGAATAQHCPRAGIISRCRKGSEGISQRKGTCWDGLLPACTFSSFKRIYFNHTTDSQARGGRQRLSPSQQLWKTPINNPTNTNCMRFPFLHSPVRTQEKIHPAAPKQ